LPDQANILTRFSLFSFAAAVIVLAGISLIKQSNKSNGDSPGNSASGVPYIWLGVFALLTAGFPFWITSIPVRLDFPWDRSTLAFLLGSSLLVVGVITSLIQPRFQWIAIILFVGLSTGQQYLSAMVYRAEWEKLRSFVWQLTWRIPGLEPGTLVVYDNPPLNRYSDTDLTGVLNWTYSPENRSKDLSYKFFDLLVRLDTEYIGLPGLEEGLTFEHNHRSLRFTGTTSKILAVDYRPPGCLHLISSADGNLPRLTEKIRKVIPLSKSSLVIVDAKPALPPAMFDPEPLRSWCYFYQKADLSRQVRDWREVTALGNTAFEKGLKPEDPLEYLPFIEGYAYQKNWEKVDQLVDAANVPELKLAVCSIWDRLNKDTVFSASDLVHIQAAQKRFNCSP
jgi:hypothetical protein